MSSQPMKRDDQHDHSRIQVSTRCSDCGEELATQTFNRADLETQQMSELPNREAMSLVNANVAIPINAAICARLSLCGVSCRPWTRG